MSVINQMLKELDQRKNSKQNSPEMVLPMNSKHAQNQYSNKKSIAPLITGIIILIILSILLYTFNYSTTSDQTSNIIDKPVAADVTINQQPVLVEPEIKPEIKETQQQEPAIDLVTEKQLKIEEVANNESTKSESIITKSVENKTENTAITDRVIKTTTTLDFNAQLEQQFITARREMSAGNVTKAEATLNSLLEKKSNFHKARVLLFSLSLQQGQHSSIEQPLLTALTKWPDVHEYRQVQARLLLAQSRQQEALFVLQQKTPTVQSAPEYHALLAYVAQQTKNDSLAIKSYQSLLGNHANRVDWWLGLAVSEERMGNTEMALKAYKQSIARPGLSSSVQVYARQRIKVIQGY